MNRDLRVLAEFNRTLNRALRAIDEVASKSAAPDVLTKRIEALAHAREALKHLMNLQELLVEQAPELAYHFDAALQPTEYMKKIAAQVQASREFERNGRAAEAIAALRKALEEEPPPFAYESIAKELRRLQGVP